MRCQQAVMLHAKTEQEVDKRIAVLLQSGFGSEQLVAVVGNKQDVGGCVATILGLSVAAIMKM